MSTLTNLPIWQTLITHQKTLANTTLSQLFAQNSQRFEQLSLTFEDLLLDFSKNLLEAKTCDLLYQLAAAVDLPKKITALFQGKPINVTEQRAALHTALRRFDNSPLLIDGQDVMPQIHAVRDQMQTLTTRIHSGQWRGFSGKTITDVVNIGIGGSDLGPRMVVTALTPFHLHKVRCHFVANVDGAELSDILSTLSPETTLFIIASKTFTTQETLTNAYSAKNWLMLATTHWREHLIGITNDIEKAVAFGVPKENCLFLPKWVGGRYSLWSAIGLPIALSVGMDGFLDLLRGAEQMDVHFNTAPMTYNLPVTLALIGIWYINFWHAQAHAVLPYDHHLSYLVPYLQQLEMESNGKAITLDNQPVDYATAPVVWGGVGTNGQHAFHQLLHQGPQFIPADFLIAAKPQHALSHHHSLLISNALGQTSALLKGRKDQAAYASTPGNRPSTTLLFKTLDPYTLGRLIALYEHKVFVQGVVWQINSFDQWGVELGKQCAHQLLPHLTQHTLPTTEDASTQGLIAHYHRLIQD